MASVPLEFIAPSEPNLALLRVYEGTSKDGAFSLIDETDEIGSYPDYINHYTTEEASSETNWFSIQWVDDKGAESPLSDPWQGNTESLVSIITGRVVQRGVTNDESVILQEAEATLEQYFGTDPYEVPLPISYSQAVGLTYLVMARLMVLDVINDTTESYTAGIIAQQTGSSDKSMKNVQKLIDEANRLLGRNYSLVVQLPEYTPVPALRDTTFDQSRLIVELT